MTCRCSETGRLAQHHMSLGRQTQAVVAPKQRRQRMRCAQRALHAETRLPLQGLALGDEEGGWGGVGTSEKKLLGRLGGALTKSR